MKVKCPKCGNTQLYVSKRVPGTKKCVYCGRLFKAKEHVVSAS